MTPLEELREELRETAASLFRLAERLQDRVAGLESEVENMRRELERRI